MFGIGLTLRIDDFKRIAQHPKAIAIGLVLQMFALPVLAALVGELLALSLAAKAGLFLVALCPGGATSNFLTYLANGRVALSVTLTAFTSVISPITLPLAFALYISFLDAPNNVFTMPLLLVIKQLAVVTLLPIIFGMSLKVYLPKVADRIAPFFKKLAIFAVVFLITVLLATHPKVVTNMFSHDGLSVILLMTLAFFIGFYISRKLLNDPAEHITIGLEVGVQNAGTAMMVAYTILKQPDLAQLPLTYGLLMNVPAVAFIWWGQSYSAMHKEKVA
jgi:BASS family bile acid:Na+ symporter